MFGFLVSCTTAVVADDYVLQQLPGVLSPTMVAEQTNPWLLPETVDKYLDYQQQRRYPGGQNPSSKEYSKADGYQHRANKIQQGRFVTPDVLEFLKQQQIQTQRLPTILERNEKYSSGSVMRRSTQIVPQFRSLQSESRLPGAGYGGVPSSAMGGFANPLYDTPVTSPWGNAPDVLYRGETFTEPSSDPFSWLPGEAIGGIPPIHIPSSGNYNYGERYFAEPGNGEDNNTEINSTGGQKENNGFNPFTFIPNTNLH